MVLGDRFNGWFSEAAGSSATQITQKTHEVEDEHTDLMEENVLRRWLSCLRTNIFTPSNVLTV